MSKNLFKRKSRIREARPAILIICEGETERHYFSGFRTHATIEKGKVGNPMTFVEEAVRLRSRVAKRRNMTFEQSWVVFDRDISSETEFQAAINNAEINGFKVAYSNQAFDFWYVLHFLDHNGNPMDRTQYEAEINKGLSFPYAKNARTLNKMYDALLPYQQDAIRRARRIYQSKGGSRHTESVTSVFLLVEELNSIMQ